MRSSWGILSIQMQKAIVADYSVSDFEKTDYPDGQEGDDLTSNITGRNVEGSWNQPEEPTYLLQKADKEEGSYSRHSKENHTMRR